MLSQMKYSFPPRYNYNLMKGSHTFMFSHNRPAPLALNYKILPKSTDYNLIDIRDSLRCLSRLISAQVRSLRTRISIHYKYFFLMHSIIYNFIEFYWIIIKLYNIFFYKIFHRGDSIFGSLSALIQGMLRINLWAWRCIMVNLTEIYKVKHS